MTPSTTDIPKILTASLTLELYNLIVVDDIPNGLYLDFDMTDQDKYKKLLLLQKLCSDFGIANWLEHYHHQK